MELVHIAEPETVGAFRLARKAFDAWRILASGEVQVQPAAGQDVESVAANFAHPAYFGNTILIRETCGLSGEAMLHAYRIRRGHWLGLHDENLKRIYPHKTDKLFAVKISAFEPVEPWRYTRGCDVIGNRNDPIESRFDPTEGDPK